MPKTAMDYSQTIIYKLVCNDLNIKECYVGHTTNWKQRKSHHRQSVRLINSNAYNSKKSKFIREHGGFDNWSMVEIEKYPCKDKQEAGARERYWYETLGAELNTYVPTRSKKEYKKMYMEQNKEYLQAQHKQYHEEHKEEIKAYREKNREHILAHKSTKYECECGSLSTISNKMRHLKSLKHCQYIDSLLLDKPIGEIILDPCETNDLTNEN